MWVRLFGVLIVALAPATTAPTTAPTTRPTTVPAVAPPRASTPTEALRSLNLALRNGDANAVRSLFRTRSELDYKLISSMAEYSAALVELHRASEQAYGAEGANTVTGDINAQSAEGLAAIDKADVALVGSDQAVVKFPGATDPPVKLVKIGGGWKLPMEQLLDGADPKTEERRLAELTLQAQLARKTAEEIIAGKHREGASIAAEVWRSRLLQPISSHPTTKPSPPPQDEKHG